ncbi:MAG TPA: RNA-directed DNA polymerase [Rhodospirillaceae bacterium]|nr:RNA-directed DNA polymerase [Rhodospirillaceae bacterium]
MGTFFDPENSKLCLRLARETRMPYSALYRLVLTAPYRYKTYKIQKVGRPGQVRIIHHPARELKTIQRWLVKNVLYSMPVHSAACAYEKNTGIKLNASKHVNNNYILKMDFKDFFPSIVPRDIFLRMPADTPWNSNDFYFLSRVLFCKKDTGTKLSLSIGAPSSPKISNIVMYEFDQKVSEYCNQKNITYTRYADDMTFSTNRREILQECEDFINGLVREMDSPHLEINASKTLHTSKKHHRRITGLVLSSQGFVSLGRERKRLIRAMLHNYKYNQNSDADKTQKLKGLLAFACDCEPIFIDNLKAKYEAEIDCLLSMKPEKPYIRRLLGSRSKS